MPILFLVLPSRKPEEILDAAILHPHMSRRDAAITFAQHAFCVYLERGALARAFIDHGDAGFKLVDGSAVVAGP